MADGLNPYTFAEIALQGAQSFGRSMENIGQQQRQQKFELERMQQQHNMELDSLAKKHVMESQFNAEPISPYESQLAGQQMQSAGLAPKLGPGEASSPSEYAMPFSSIGGTVNQGGLAGGKLQDEVIGPQAAGPSGLAPPRTREEFQSLQTALQHMHQQGRSPQDILNEIAARNAGAGERADLRSRTAKEIASLNENGRQGRAVDANKIKQQNANTNAGKAQQEKQKAQDDKFKEKIKSSQSNINNLRNTVASTIRSNSQALIQDPKLREYVDKLIGDVKEAEAKHLKAGYGPVEPDENSPVIDAFHGNAQAPQSPPAAGQMVMDSAPPPDGTRVKDKKGNLYIYQGGKRVPVRR